MLIGLMCKTKVISLQLIIRIIDQSLGLGVGQLDLNLAVAGLEVKQLPLELGTV